MNTQLLFVEGTTGHSERYGLSSDYQLIDGLVGSGIFEQSSTLVGIGLTSGTVDLLSHSAATGAVILQRFNEQGLLTSNPVTGTPGPAWDLASLYGYDSTGRPLVLFYDRETGTAQLHAVTTNGGFERVFVSTGWNQTWTAMVTFVLSDGSGADMLLYAGSSGNAQIWRIALDGTYSHIKNFIGWSPNWTRLAVLARRQDEADILFYASNNATAQVWTIRRNGTIEWKSSLSGWRTTWNHIVCMDPATLKSLPGVPGPGADLEGYILSLGELQAAALVSRVPMPVETKSIEGISYQIQREAVRLTQVANEFTILNPVADQLWPGAVLQGRSLSGNQLSPVPLPRSGGTLTITTDLVGAGRQNTSARLDNPSLATATDLRRALLEQAAPTDSAGAITVAMSSARTLEHGLVNLGVNVKYQAVTVDLKANLDHELKTNTVIARILQVYYTVAFEPNAGAGAFFDRAVTPQQLRPYCGPSNPPVYISQVSYGRSLLLVVEAQASNTTIKGALDVLVKAAANVHFQVSGEYRQLVDTMSIRVFEAGSTGIVLKTLFDGKVAEITDNLLSYIRAGASFSLRNPGAPVSFTTRHLGSRTPAFVGLTTDFTEVVSVSSPEVTGALQIADGWSGGPKPAGVRVGRGDKIIATAGGLNWSGVIGSRLYGPDGHPQQWWVFGPISTDGFPLPNETPFMLIGGFDRQDWVPVGSAREFLANWSSGSGPKELWFGTNDSDPYNGDDGRRFDVSWRVQRATAEQLGLHGVGRR